MSEVIGLRGGVVPDGRTPNENVVRQLEMALDAARSGEIVGIALVTQTHDVCCGYRTSGQILSYTALGAVSAMQHNLLEAITDGD